jgi:hypothetical protein
MLDVLRSRACMMQMPQPLSDTCFTDTQHYIQDTVHMIWESGIAYLEFACIGEQTTYKTMLDEVVHRNHTHTAFRLQFLSYKAITKLRGRISGIMPLRTCKPQARTETCQRLPRKASTKLNTNTLVRSVPHQWLTRLILAVGTPLSSSPCRRTRR